MHTWLSIIHPLNLGLKVREFAHALFSSDPMISIVFKRFWITSGVRYISMSRTALADIILDRSNFTTEPKKLCNMQPLILPVRFKGKNKVRKDTGIQ